MKINLLIAKVALSISLFPALATAQSGYWQQLNGLTGGFSEAMIASPDGTIYLATEWELFKRHPAASEWERAGMLPFELDGVLSQPLFAADGRLFLMNDNEGTGMEFSTDEGQSWITTSTSIYGIASVRGMLYGFNDGEILRSTDSGSSWKIIFDDTASIQFNNISVSGVGGKMYVSSSSGIYSNIAGDSVWIRIDSTLKNDIPGSNRPLFEDWSQVFEVDSAICIASPDGSGSSLYRTSDAGVTWETVSPQYLSNLGIITRDSNGTLWMVAFPHSGWYRLMLSNDSGKTWLNGNFEIPVDGNIFCVSPSNDLCMQTQQHVYLYSRTTQHWSLWEDSLYNSNIFAILPLSDDTILIACNQGYYRTTNGGESWVADSMDASTTVHVVTQPHEPSNLVRDHEGYIYSTQNDFNPDSGIWREEAGALAVDSSDFIYAQGSTQTYGTTSLLRSSDHGASWTALLESSYNWTNMTVDQRGRILAAVQWSEFPGYGRVLRSTDHGESWDTIYAKADVWPPDEMGPIAVSQNGTILAQCYGSNTLGSYYMIESNDDGSSWQQYDQFEPWAFALDGSNKLYAAGLVSAPTLTRGVLISTDTGKTGQLLSFSTDTGFSVVAVSPNHTLFAGTQEDGLFRFVPAASSVETPASSPDNFTIFPNPASNEIQITSSEGNISILDPLGRSYEVKQSGNTLDISSLPSGVYFVSDGHTRAKFVKE